MLTGQQAAKRLNVLLGVIVSGFGGGRIQIIVQDGIQNIQYFLFLSFYSVKIRFGDYHQVDSGNV